jgi:hypothetical protein
MTPSPHSRESPAGIFISYRRSENIPQAGRLHDNLSNRFGQRPVFIDYESIEPGRDFVEAIEEAVSSCRILLAVIGRDWLTCSDEHGRRRLDDPEDFVRLEIATALNRGVRVIPVLVQGAVMPHEKDLPVDMAALARRQSCVVRDLGWNDDVRKLIGKISADVQPPKRMPVARVAAVAVLLLLALLVLFILRPFKMLRGVGARPTPAPVATASPTPAASTAPAGARILTGPPSPSPAADGSSTKPGAASTPTPAPASSPTPKTRRRTRSHPAQNATTNGNCNQRDYADDKCTP